MSTGVILLAYGGPDTLDDVPAFLLDVRGGRPTPDELVHEVTERYRLIGGRSPLLDITQRVAGKLQEALGMPVYVGMRHWHPYIKDVVPRIASDGVDTLVAICMAPHASSVSTGAYRARLDEALGQVDTTMEVRFVQNWHTQPEYVDALAANVQAALARFDPQERESAVVIFTAHSLPLVAVQRGDTYEEQLRETGRLVAQRLNLPQSRWMVAFQSAGQTGTPWLGPQIEEVVPALAERGLKSQLAAPAGFISEHVEVLYDLDIALQDIARAHGVHLERTAMLNDDDRLVAALASIVQEALKPATALRPVP